VNRIANQPLMSSMVIGGYKNVDVANPRRGYWKPFVVIVLILNHKDCHYVKPNMLAFNYHDFKKKKIQMFMLKCSILQ
jgi:hypothetical protein